MGITSWGGLQSVLLKSGNLGPSALEKPANAIRWEFLAKKRTRTMLSCAFSVLKTSTPLALTGAVAVEFYGSDKRLGYLVRKGATSLETDLLFMAIGLIAFICIASVSIFSQIEEKVGDKSRCGT
mgnify:CR=1 FL=1